MSASSRRFYRLGTAAGLALAGFLTFSLGTPSAAGDAAGTAPDFARPALDGASTVRLSTLRGKVVLLNFWASWCGPCLKEMPRLSAWQREFGNSGLQVLGVSMDDDAVPVRRLLARQPVSYPVIMGDAELGRTYGGVLGLPVSFLIDTEGRIVARLQGETDLYQLEARIKVLLPRRAQ